MKKITSLIFVLILNLSSFISAQETPVEKGLRSITPDAIKGQLGFLASDWTEGREAGEKGEFLSSDYIASILQLSGIKPGGDYIQARGVVSVQKRAERSYFQNFSLLKRKAGKDQILKINTRVGETVMTCGFTYGIDFLLRPSLSGVEIEAPVVFAGYGFKNENLRFNDFAKLDVKGKFILKITGVPGFAIEKLSPSQINAYARELENYARSMGAVGIIEFNPNSSLVSSSMTSEFYNMSPAEMNPRSSQPNTTFTLPGRSNTDNFLRISVSSKVANEILKGSGVSTDDYINSTRTGSQYIFPVIREKSIYIKSEVINTLVPVRNVIGIIEGKNPEQVIVVGAHYDHMGIRNGYIWNGADDNASGTVGVMTLARAIMAADQIPDKTIIIALWTAEEKGLLGSRYYIDNLSYPLKNLRLNVNFDMISRYIADNEPTKVIMTYSSSEMGFRSLTETNLKKYSIDINMEFQPSANPPGGSDHQSFVAAGIPIMRFKPGHREEYHTPYDEINTLNWDIMEKIIRISFANIWELSNNEW